MPQIAAIGPIQSQVLSFTVPAEAPGFAGATGAIWNPSVTDAINLVEPVGLSPVDSLPQSDTVPARWAGRGLSSALRDVPSDHWRELGERAAEPNGYYLPEWTQAIDAHSRGRMNLDALTAYSDDSVLTGMMPVVSAWRAYRLPLPVLVTADVYPPLGTVLLDGEKAVEAVRVLMREARAGGAHALVLRDTPIDGPVMEAFKHALAASGLHPHILDRHERAMLDATRDADDLLRDALGNKKLKELRRQRNRLNELGEVVYTIASLPEEVADDLEIFLRVEASGWKGRRGTALLHDEHDVAFLRRAVPDMAARGNCQIVCLFSGDTPVASAIVLRHLDRAFYFKMGVDETFAKYSPGVQLTLELTRQMCADPAIAVVDSIADPGHPMIDPIWRGRLAIGDVLIPLYRSGPLTPLIRFALLARSALRTSVKQAVARIRG